MHKRKLITYTGKGFDVDRFSAGMLAYHDANTKKGYGPMIGYELISIDTDFTDTGNGWNATCTQVYKSNRIPKHHRIENAKELEAKKNKKKVSKAEYYKQHLDLLEPENKQV